MEKIGETTEITEIAEVETIGSQGAAVTVGPSKTKMVRMILMQNGRRHLKVTIKQELEP